MGNTVLRTLAVAPDAAVLRALRVGLGDDHRLSVVFHRVAETRDKLTMPAREIDALIDFLLRVRGEVTVSFDDGFADAAEYVRDRASRFAGVRWLFFVCPFQTELGLPGLEPLAGVRELAALPNVNLGNHTNLHARLSALSDEDGDAQLTESVRDFERLFGSQRHFAFPYGVPGVDFDERHVRTLRRLGRFSIWSTEPRPFHEGDDVLPRLCIDGRRSWKESAAHVAAHALRWRAVRELRRTRGSVVDALEGA